MALRAAKNLSWAALNRCHSASSRSLAARPAAFHSVRRSRNAAPVGPQSVESDSASARSHSASLACLTPTRSRSSSAKCEPRRRLNVSRAAEYRFHSASSVLRSRPVIVRHSSRISRSRSPAAFHCVDVVAMSSASAASASLRAVCAARCSSRRWRSRRRGGVGLLDDRGQPGGQCVDVAEHRRGGQALGERGRGGLDLAGVAGARGQPALHQRDLGVQVVVAAPEVRVRGLGVAGLPRPDGALTGRGDQPDRAVGVDAAEPVRVARWRVRDHGRSVAGPAGAGARRSRSGARAWVIRLTRWSSYPSSSCPPRGDPRTCRATRRHWLFARYSNRCAPSVPTPLRQSLPKLGSRWAGARPPRAPGGERLRRRNDTGAVAVDKADIAALLALGAAFFIAIGDVIHQRSAHEVTDEPVGHLGLFTRLLRDRQWWLGSVVSAVGLRAAGRGARLGLGAAGAGPPGHVAAVRAADQRPDQPARRVTRCQWTWAALLAAVGRRHRDRRQPDRRASRARRWRRGRWSSLCSGPALVLCVIGARICPRARPARCCSALVSGALWGVFAVLTKGVVDRLDDGVWALLRTPELYAWAAGRRSRAPRGSRHRSGRVR